MQIPIGMVALLKKEVCVSLYRLYRCLGIDGGIGHKTGRMPSLWPYAKTEVPYLCASRASFENNVRHS